VTKGRPRILVAIGSLDVGGAEGQIVELVRGLAGRFEFHIALASAGGPLEAPARSAGATIHILRVPGFGAGTGPVSRVIRALRMRGRLRTLLRELAPSLIHSWLFEASFVAAAARWPGRKPPLIVSRRSLVEWVARNRLYFLVARWTNGQADLMLANSEAVRRDVMRKEGVKAERVELIYNGVDTSVYTPGPPDEDLRRELGLPPGVPVVGMVANLHTYKGHVQIVEVAATLRAEGRSCALLFVGRDADAAAAVRRAVTHARLENVVFTGARPDVSEMLRLMDVFVSASHEEGFSNSILEAMASGRAIVATSVGGTPEQIEDGVTGFVVPPRDPVALSAAVGRLLGDSALRRRFGEAARKKAVERFGRERLFEEMAALYTAWTARS
jgi:glycosyltransferase involved in cell wall biosynthesis